MLRVSNAEISLLDIAPTLVKSSGIDSLQRFDGISLVDPLVTDLKQTRYYHFDDKKDKRGKNKINYMVRFRIERFRLTKEGVVY